MKTRKYENDFEIINTKGIKFLGEYDFHKIVIHRKEKANKKDTCIKYRCGVYMSKEDNWAQSWILDEPFIDKIVEANK